MLTEGEGGQKIQKLVNLVCEWPLMNEWPILIENMHGQFAGGFEVVEHVPARLIQ